jgi:ribonuclease-3
MRFGIVKSGSGSQGGEGDSDNEKKKGLEEGESSSPEVEPLGREHYHKIEEVLGYKFQNFSWLQRALTHRSLQLKGNKTDYERLEFLGDAVLDLAIAQLLLDRHQEAREGELSKMRAALVNTNSLAEIARRLNLGPFIRLSRGELANGGSDRPSILADVFEALMGAIYREAGYNQALSCVEKLFGEMLTNVEPRDPKTELQEALHAAGSEAPAYLLECVEGPEHAPTFVSVVQVDGQVVGRGRGATKKASQQAAAGEALALLRSDEDSNKTEVKPQLAEAK